MELSGHLPALAAEYLLMAKNAEGQPLDPVARFHDLTKAEQYHEAYAEQNALHVAKGVTRLLKKKEAAK